MFSIVIFAKNNEREIEETIKSAKLLSADIQVIDIESADKTRELAKKFAAKVLSFPHTYYVEPVRDFGIQNAKSDWVLILDADERITKELAKEIKLVIENPQFSYYKIPRKNIFGKVKWLKYGGWWPDHQIRLINKKFFISWPKKIHSTPLINGEMGYLKNYLLHYSHGDFEAMVNKTTIFENIESDLLLEAGHSVSIRTFFRKFMGELWRRAFKNFGFLDGTTGIIESIYQAFSKTITYLFLYEKSKP